MTEHTPGPWQAIEEQAARLNKTLIVVAPMQVVCRVGDPRGKGVIDDARLIATAPELLKELQNLVNAVDEYIEAACRDGEPVYLSIPESTRAVISKATGQS